MFRRVLAVAAAALCANSAAYAKAGDAKADAKTEAKPAGDDPLAKYFAELLNLKLIDVESGNIESLRRELQVAETLLRDGAFTNAAVALYAIVKSPRYTAFTDFVEYQNAEYDLAVALARAGSYGAALQEIDDILRRGPAAQYWGPAHRRAVDIAIETRDHAGVLARIEAIKTADPIPPSAAGERSYLRGRAFYDAGKLADAEGELVLISKKSRLYSSAVYLRGVIKARRGDLKESAEAMCEIAATPDNDKYTFVVDDRYFTIKDLARLGLGRIAHENSEYDDAYYHYFQIPDDSPYLPDALFEASWGMYQKRELDTSRDLVKEFLKTFPSSPLWPEASLLSGYVELADCKFDASRRKYDALIGRLQPIVDEIDKIKHDPALRRQLFTKALTRFHEVKSSGELDGKKPGTQIAPTPFDDVLGLLKLKPDFIRLAEAVTGSHELADSAPNVTRAWQNLGAQIAEQHISKVATDKTLEQEQLADASSVLEDYRRLAAQIASSKDELARGKRENLVPEDVAADETKRLDELAAKVASSEKAALAATDKAAAAVAEKATPGLRPLIQADTADARRLDRAAHDMSEHLDQAGE